MSLLDIAPARELVQIGDHSIPCRGISAGDLVALVQRFPSLRETLWNGREAMTGAGEIDAAGLIREAPDAIGAILAAGTGDPGKADAEAVAANLGLEHQVDLLAAIIRCTLPSGFGPFVEKVTAIFGAAAEGARRLPIDSGESVHPLPNGAAGPATISPSQLNA